MGTPGKTLDDFVILEGELESLDKFKDNAEVNGRPQHRRHFAHFVGEVNGEAVVITIAYVLAEFVEGIELFVIARNNYRYLGIADELC